MQNIDLYIEFCLPDSTEIIDSSYSYGVPRVADRVSLKGVPYRVYSVKWVAMHEMPNRKLGVIIEVIEDEIEIHTKLKKNKGKYLQKDADSWCIQWL